MSVPERGCPSPSAASTQHENRYLFHVNRRRVVHMMHTDLHDVCGMSDGVMCAQIHTCTHVHMCTHAHTPSAVNGHSSAPLQLLPGHSGAHWKENRASNYIQIHSQELTFLSHFTWSFTSQLICCTDTACLVSFDQRRKI